MVTVDDLLEVMFSGFVFVSHITSGGVFSVETPVSSMM